MTNVDGAPVPEKFDYMVTDSDGSTVPSSITFAIGDTGATGGEASYELLEGASGSYTAPGGTSLDMPVTVVPGEYEGSLGTVVTVAADGSFSYTAPVRDHSDQTADNETFTFKLVDSDGSLTTSKVTLEIVDDEPTAYADSGIATEGGTLTVAQLDGALANDVVGADVDGAVVSVTAGQLTVDAGTAIAGQYDTLTLHTDGSYSYAANASVDADEKDVFTYTMKDADGDTSQATLTITFTGDRNAPTAEQLLPTMKPVVLQ